MGQKCVSLKEYIELQGDKKDFVDHIIKNNLNANPILRLRKENKIKEKQPKESSLWAFSWNDIVLLRVYMQENNMIEILKIVYDISEKALLKADVFNVFSCYNWIIQELQHIGQSEKDELYNELTPAQKNAGVEKLQRFDYVVTLDHLAGGDLLKYDAILELPYSSIFRKLALDQTKHEIQEHYMKNQTKK